MKQFRTVAISLVVGLLIGLGLGVNIGRDKPLLSNPCSRETLAEQAKRLGAETLEHGGKAIEKAGESLQDRVKKP